MTAPLVTIITPAYNSAATLIETAQSIFAQTFTDWEWIIADDVSTDNTRDVIEKLKTDNTKIRSVFIEKRGVISSRQAALQWARGRYIAFLDADDLWVPEKLQRQLGFMKDRQAAFSYTSYRRINEDGSLTGHAIHIPAQLTYDTYLKNTAIACSTVMIDRELSGPFDLPPGWHQDFGNWLAILKRGHVAYGLSEDLMRYRIRKGSISYNKFRSMRNVWATYRHIEKMPRHKAAYCLAHYGLRAVLKRLRF